MSVLRKLAISCSVATFLLLQSAATDPINNTQIVNIQECRQQGFDPTRLACPTCDWLPVKFQAACQKCCQSYLGGAKRRTHPYQAAVLVKSVSTEGRGVPTEMDMLVNDKDEWDMLLQTKGERLRVMTRTLEHNIDAGRDLLSLYLSRSRPAVEVLLLDETLSTDQLSYETLKEKATEIISLQGLSKDDIKDLLMTLLPSTTKKIL